MVSNEAEAVPPFDLKGSRYDQTTYAGRLRRFRDMTDPRMLLVSDERLAQAQALLMTTPMARTC